MPNLNQIKKFAEYELDILSVAEILFRGLDSHEIPSVEELSAEQKSDLSTRIAIIYLKRFMSPSNKGEESHGDVDDSSFLESSLEFMTWMIIKLVNQYAELAEPNSVLPEEVLADSFTFSEFSDNPQMYLNTLQDQHKKHLMLGIKEGPLSGQEEK